MVLTCFVPPSVAAGGGLMRVDNLKNMVEVLSSKYKINVQWVCRLEIP